jgi:hypothetical protein
MHMHVVAFQNDKFAHYIILKRPHHLKMAEVNLLSLTGSSSVQLDDMCLQHSIAAPAISYYFVNGLHLN